MNILEQKEKVLKISRQLPNQCSHLMLQLQQLRNRIAGLVTKGKQIGFRQERSGPESSSTAEAEKSLELLSGDSIAVLDSANIIRSMVCNLHVTVSNVRDLLRQEGKETEVRNALMQAKLILGGEGTGLPYEELLKESANLLMQTDERTQKTGQIAQIKDPISGAYDSICKALISMS